MSDSDDWFDDSDVDFDEVFSTAAAEAGQNGDVLKSQRNQIEDSSTVPVWKGNKQADSSSHHAEQSQNDELLTLRGENSILRAQIEQATKKQEDEQREMRLRYSNLMKDKDSKIEGLRDSIGKFKEENEFLTSENRTLSGKYIRSKKRKISDVKSQDTSIETTPNPQPIAIMNQATIFQDEKMLFIESITSQVIPGMEQTILGYLSKISSSFSYHYKEFSVGRPGESIKTSIVNYLIGIEIGNRIDRLISSFVDILLNYVVRALEGVDADPSKDPGSLLLPVPYMLSLVFYSLNYRPKAIGLDVFQRTTLQICGILDRFPEILKQDIFYLTVPGDSNENSSQNSNASRLKTMHVKILETFTVCYSMDILETLAKLAMFAKSFSDDDEPLSTFWSIVPQQMIVYSLLSTKTPASFIHSTLEMLISSITETCFAFENVSIEVKPSVHSRKLLTPTEATKQIFNNIIILLNEDGLDEHLNINMYGLSRSVGDNSMLELLEILTPIDGLSSNPITHSNDVYEKVLHSGNIAGTEAVVQRIKLKILQVFELYMSYGRGSELEPDMAIRLISAMISRLGKEQEVILRGARACNMELRIQTVATIVRVIHFLVSTPGSKMMQSIPQISLREMVIALLRISADSVKNISVEMITKLRLGSKFQHPIFNENFETSQMDRMGVTSESLNELTQVEISNSNGLEINYDDETIDMARDILGQCLTCDEADMLHYSINYEQEDISM